MEVPIEKDKRYKVNQAIVNQMRDMRNNKQSYKVIADHFNVSQHTAYYWCNEKYRKQKQAINAKRVHTDPDEIERKIKKQTKQRLWKRKQYPIQGKIDTNYWSAKHEYRTIRKTADGLTMKELETAYQKIKCKNNQKVK